MAEDKKKKIDVAVIEVTEEYLKEKLYKIRATYILVYQQQFRLTVTAWMHRRTSLGNTQIIRKCLS